MTNQPIFSLKKRLPQTKRANRQDIPNFRLTDRDGEIVKAVHHFRVLTTHQLARLFFPNISGRINPRFILRLKLLFRNGYLRRMEQLQRYSEGKKPFLYFLNTKGAELLTSNGEELTWKKSDNNVSPFFLNHLLKTNDVRIALSAAAEKNGYQITEWRDEATLKSPQQKDEVYITGKGQGKRKAAVVPDSYFILETDDKIFHHFLEIDLGTTVGEYSKWGRRDFARKIAAYIAYFKSGKYEKRYHTKSGGVLTITTTETRLTNLKTITEKVGDGGTVLNRFWFTTFDLLKNFDPLKKPIWQTAGKPDLTPLIFAPKSS